MKIILKETLERKNISQYKLARETGMSDSAISNLCTGKTDRIKFDTLQKICDALQCDVSEIMQPDNFTKKDDTK